MCITADIRKPCSTLNTLSISLNSEIADLVEEINLDGSYGYVAPELRERLRALRQYQSLIRAVKLEVATDRDNRTRIC